MSNDAFLTGGKPRKVRTIDGKVRPVPAGWSFLPPGDAALTRRVKLAGEHWIVQEDRRRRKFTRGIWAPTATIERIKLELAAERSTENFAKRKAADARRRAKAQEDYVEEFTSAVLAYLAFHERYADLAQRLAKAVAAHATPVGSGTIARSRQIPIERRAKAAVIAWMRHQTTSYDWMDISAAKGERRDVRRMLSQQSRELLARYRRGETIGNGCPLTRALKLSHF